ncbi:hypothetical protein ACQPXM_06695 [Kribbella sp. CA-253562]|uniref:hypothetical protein n=1 Tax=Kribbella sp. CA-253562 TaxID=3239942 RepID=UPI003D948F50
MREILKESLEARAADAPDLLLIRDDLKSRIRRRRRRKLAIVGGVSVLALSVLTTGALMILPSSDPDPMIPAASPGQGLPGCGSRFDPRPEADSVLRLEGTVPPASLKGSAAISVTIKITNTSTATQQLMTNSSGAKLYVIRDRRVLAMSTPDRGTGKVLALAPGQSYEYHMNATLRACGESEIDPGRYDIYAVQSFIVGALGNADQRTVDVQGGPWGIAIN